MQFTIFLDKEVNHQYPELEKFIGLNPLSHPYEGETAIEIEIDFFPQGRSEEVLNLVDSEGNLYVIYLIVYEDLESESHYWVDKYLPCRTFRKSEEMTSYIEEDALYICL